LFGFEPQAGYVAKTAEASDVLEQWKGYWIRVLVPGGVTLLIPGQNSRSRAPHRSATAAGAPTAPRLDWSVRLRAQAEGQATPAASATFGVARGATDGFDNRLDREAPPAILPGVAIEFPHAEWGHAAGRYVTDVRGSGSGSAAAAGAGLAAAGASWSAVVSSPTDGKVTLTWDGLGAVPRRTRLVLVDKATGARVPLRSRSAYTFTAQAGRSRAFEIVPEAERTLPLAIADLTMTRTRGAATNGLAIGYVVTDSADIAIEVQALGGRTLRRLQGGRAERGAGRQTVVWDGRAQDGGALPAGVYTLTITARGADGALARQTRPVLLLN
jgi:hypothetical protein